MAYLDQGRLHDLDEIYREYQMARGERRLYLERLMSEIVHQSKGNYQLRDELIKAFRVGDKNRINYCRRELMILRAQETAGSGIQV